MQKKLDKMVKLGHDEKTALQALQANNFDMEKSLEKLSKESKSFEVKDEQVKNEIFKVMAKNEQALEVGDSGEINLNLDMESIGNMLGISSEELQTMIMNNPQAVEQIIKSLAFSQGDEEFEDGEEGEELPEGFEVEEDFEDLNPDQEEIVFTEEEEKVI